MYLYPKRRSLKMEKAPKYWKGKEKVFDDISEGPRLYGSEAEAEWKLGKVREEHPESGGWLKVDTEKKQTAKGWVVSWHYAKYK